MKSVFRQSALDKLTSVEQLDKTLKITSPLSWLALVGVTVIIIATIIWSIIGTLPTTVTANGMIVNANTSTNTIKAGINGTVQMIVTQGETLNMGTGVVAEIINNYGIKETLYSDQVGYVSQVLVKVSDKVDAQTELIRVRPYLSSGQKEVVVCYVSLGDAGKIQRGMKVNVFLSSADGSTYGHMSGRVINIDTSATSGDGIEAVVGKNNGIASSFTNNGPVCAVTCELNVDRNTKSGYAWSNEKGAARGLSVPEMCSVKIITEEVPPITKFIAKLKDLWGSK